MLTSFTETQRQTKPPHPVLLPSRTAGQYFNNGRLMQQQGRRVEAADCYQRALALAPADLPLWNQIGAAFLKLNQPERAVFCYRQIARRVPQFAEASACLGSALRAAGCFDEAALCLRRALTLKPHAAGFHNSLGTVLRDLGHIDEAVAHYHQALLLQPDSADARWNLALAQLLEGNFAEGWRNYEARWQRADPPCRFPQPLWRGEPLKGARILLHAEQGLGDNLQFLRFVPQVEAAGGRVLLGLPPRQHSLAKTLPGVTESEFATTPPQSFDWHCPLMSLPLALGTTLETLPARVPYFAVPPAARKRAVRLDWPTKGLRVGLVWSGTPEHPSNRFRAIPLERFKPLLSMTDVHFFSLQMGVPAEELDPWRHKIVDLAPATRETADTAAQMEQLDLILTVDTMAAHLAGALGFRVWLLLAFNHDWRWMRDRDDSPWYPTMRLFRQSAPGDWQPVLERVRDELTRMRTKRLTT